MNRIKALKRIEGLTPEALADALGDNGFSSCRQLVIDKEIDGKQFLGITEYQTKQFKQYLKPGELQRLWFFIVRINEHPEEFVIGDAEYLNINSAPTKKTLSESSYKLPPPLPPSSSYNLPPPTPSSHNSPSPIIPAQKPTQLPKPSSNIPKPPLTKNQRPVNILPKPTMPMPSFNSGKSIPPPPLSNSRKPPSSNLNSGSKLPPPPPLNIFAQPPPVNTSSKLPPPPPSSNSSRPPPPPLSNSSRPLPPVSNSSRTPPPPPLSNSSRTPPPPPLTNSSKPPPPPIINSAKPTLPTPKILLPPTIPISTNPSPSPLLSPSVDIIESLRDNIRNKFKNAIPESDDSDSPEDWYEDEDLSAAPAPYQETEEEFYMNYDNAHGAEMENERQRRKSSEEFMANRLKLEMHLKGHRTDDGEEENKAKATAIYVNIEELKLEQEKTTVHSPPKFDLKELQSKIKVTEPEIDVPPPAPKRPNQNLITPQRKVSDDRNKQRTLPQPPVNLPNILLGVPPQRPPKNENSARKGDQSPMNASKFHSESSLVNEEGTYEPPPHVNDIPNSLKTFIEMDHLRQARNNPETIAQEGDYLIPNEVLQNKGSIFTKQYVPLPPIPTPPMHEDELYRSEYFQNITNRDVASKMFESKPVGHFFLRPSKNYSCTLMIKGERKILNVPVLYEGYRYKLLADTSESIAEETFMTLNDLVEYYQSHPIMVKKTRVLLRSWK